MTMMLKKDRSGLLEDSGESDKLIDNQAQKAQNKIVKDSDGNTQYFHKNTNF